jgi:hypothetical protein
MIVAKTSDGLLIILQPDNLARMKVGDPVTIPDFGLTICYEELAQNKLIEKLKSSDPRAYLMRGWQEHPDDFRKMEKA